MGYPVRGCGPREPGMRMGFYPNYRANRMQSNMFDLLRCRHALKGQQHIAQGKRSDTLGYGVP